MKKILKLALLCFIFISCEQPNTIIPFTDIEEFKNENGFIFPVQTKAMDILNCLNTLEDTSNISGSYTKTETATLNGKLYSDTIVYRIDAAEITYSRQSDVHTYQVIFTGDKRLVYTYKWQRDVSNVWENTVLDGEIVISLP